LLSWGERGIPPPRLSRSRSTTRGPLCGHQEFFCKSEFPHRGEPGLRRPSATVSIQGVIRPSSQRSRYRHPATAVSQFGRARFQRLGHEDRQFRQDAASRSGGAHCTIRPRLGSTMRANSKWLTWGERGLPRPRPSRSTIYKLDRLCGEQEFSLCNLSSAKGASLGALTTADGLNFRVVWRRGPGKLDLSAAPRILWQQTARFTGSRGSAEPRAPTGGRQRELCDRPMAPAAAGSDYTPQPTASLQWAANDSSVKTFPVRVNTAPFTGSKNIQCRPVKTPPVGREP